MDEIRFGFLPLYLKLYDEVSPQRRGEMEAFYHRLADEFRRRGFRPLTADPCRVSDEFERAVRGFEEAGACALLTLHLAYSPSLESIQALAGTDLPIVVLDTTPDPDFGPQCDPARIMNNHGIHGVQDMCNLLRRRGKDFFIEAGHPEQSGVLDRVGARLQGAALAAALRSVRTGIVGESFEGMGDFAVPRRVLADLTGHEPVVFDKKAAERCREAVTQQDIEEEMARDRERFSIRDLDETLHRASTAAGLTLRRWLEAERIDAFSVNFMSVTGGCGLEVMPFLEISKAMARGTGYAGEGDLLTASLAAAIASWRREMTFTEMFCPDWSGNRVFLSHMGEVNVDLVAGKPELSARAFPYTDAGDPVAATGRLKPGPAVFLNLAPLAEGRFRLIFAPCRMHDARRDRFSGKVRGWMEPQVALEEFLETYSRFGGTHHGVLVYGGGDGRVVESFGGVMGWEVEGIFCGGGDG